MRFSPWLLHTGEHEPMITESGLQIRVHIGKLFSLFLIQNICCGYSKHMFKLMGKKII